MIRKIAIGLMGIGFGLLASSLPLGIIQIVLNIMAIISICHALFYDGPEID